MALILIRHGQTDANLEKRIQGTNPDPLNTVGIQQAHACAQRLYDYFKANNKSIAAIKTSDIVRAKQTTDIIHSVLSQHF
jgi:broad specificity phosphatase PhoE